MLIQPEDNTRKSGNNIKLAEFPLKNQLNLSLNPCKGDTKQKHTTQ